MLIVRYQLADGTQGEDIVLAGQKWTFGRPGGEETPTVTTSDRRVSRGALVVRDSGPGPVVFRGQRGDVARVGLVSTDGSTQWLAEGTAGHVTATARRVTFHLDDEHVVTLEVDFTDRGTVAERQQRGGHLSLVPDLGPADGTDADGEAPR